MTMHNVANWLQTAGVYLYFVMLAGLSVYGLHRFWMLYLYYRHRHDPPRPADQWRELPTVTVQLPLYNERCVVGRLLEAVARLDYPRDRLQIQVLDDSTDDTRAIVAQKVATLAAAGLNIQHLHRERRDGFKAGALREAMPQVQGEFIAIYDADFIPPPNALHAMIHYFTDPRVGMVQTRWAHLNERQSLLTRVQGILLDGHFVIEHVARSRSGRFFNFNGTGGMWRRTCIEGVGGWHSETLAEDLDLSYRAQIAGWQCVYLADVTTPAELPVEINAYKNQQYRWTKGTAQTARRLLPVIWRSRLPLKVKVEATVRLTSNLCFIMMVLLCLTFPIQLLASRELAVWPALRHSLLVEAPVFFAATLSVLTFYICAQRELRRDWWRQLPYLPALMIIGIGLCLNNARAVIEGLAGHRSDFVRTPKVGASTAARAAGGWPKSYQAWRGWTPYFELAMGLYFSVTLLAVIARQHWLAMPFVLIFQIGFISIGLLSLFPTQWRPSEWLGWSKPRWLNPRPVTKIDLGSDV